MVFSTGQDFFFSFFIQKIPNKTGRDNTYMNIDETKVKVYYSLTEFVEVMDNRSKPQMMQIAAILSAALEM